MSCKRTTQRRRDRPGREAINMQMGSLVHSRRGRNSNFVIIKDRHYCWINIPTSDLGIFVSYLYCAYSLTYFLLSTFTLGTWLM
jgi:hypothetical protein